jgi:PKD repeat protein
MTRYLEDTFARTVGTAGNTPGTWGTADFGGAWSVGVTSGVLGFRTDGVRGRVEWTTGSGGAGYGLLSSAQPALEVHGCLHARLNIGTQLGSGILWARCSGALATFTGYGIRLGRSSTGGLNAELVRGPQDAAVVIATMAGSPTWPDYTTYYRAELEVLGSNPTTIRGRWFPAGSPPADDEGWTTVTDSTGPQAAGVYGFRGQRTGSVATEYYVDTMWMADPLRPAFTATPGPDGLTVTFTSSTLTTGDPRAHGWTFGDGTDATTADPVKVYAAEGTYTVTYTAWTAWGTRRTVSQSVVVARPPMPEDIRPAVYVNGEDICDRVYQMSWATGRERWPDESNGSSITMQIRGRMPDVQMGAPVIVQLPVGAPDGTARLWTGEVDDITEAIDPIEARTTTTLVAMDVMAFLSRWHILPASTFVEGGLPTRLLSLAPRGTTVYRPKWSGVASSRWPLLKSLAMAADELRKRTYLDLLRDGLRASLATAYVAPDGAIVYGPLDPPAGYVPTVLDLDSLGPDCANAEDIARSTAEGMVNRWTVGDGAVVDRVERPSIEAYGESVWTVGKGVLKTESTFPITDPIAAQMREPFAARAVTIPIRSWSARSYLAQPLDMAQMDGQLFCVMGVRHGVTLDEWTVTLLLDRDPWTMTGSSQPVPPTPARTTTQTFECSKDALLASPDMGAGKSTRLPVGYYSGTKFRALIQFDLAWAHTPKKVTLSELLLDTAGQDAVAYGSNPQIQIDRITGSWSEGGSGGSGPPWTYSTANAVVYPGPSITSAGRKLFNVTNNENTALTLAMTEITRAWADGSSNRGIRIISQDEGSSSRTIEFYSREHSTSSRRPQLRVTYEY